MGLEFEAWPSEATKRMVASALSMSAHSEIRSAERLGLIEMVKHLGTNLREEEYPAFVDHVLRTAGLLLESSPRGRTDESTEIVQGEVSVTNGKESTSPDMGAARTHSGPSARPKPLGVTGYWRKWTKLPPEVDSIDSVRNRMDAAQERARTIFRSGTRWLKNGRFVDEFHEDGKLVEYEQRNSADRWSGTWQPGSHYEPGLGDLPCVGIQVGVYFSVMWTIGSTDEASGYETTGGWPNRYNLVGQGFSPMRLQRL